jgi:hypothetical protein
MKNLNKNIIPFCIVLIILILTGCENIFNPDALAVRSGNGLTVTVSGDKLYARTLYPNAEFTRYVLDFTGPAGATHQETLTNGQNYVTVSDLAAGEWTVFATGYVKIKNPITQEENEYAAADGETTVTLNGTIRNININISAKKTGDNGYFSYSVNFPASKVSAGTLEIFEVISEDNYQSRDLLATPSDLIELPPGYYFMRISLSNDYQITSRIEIVHIYSNMETKAEYTFCEDDFVDYFILSGTADVTVNKGSSNNVFIAVYSDSAYNVWLGYSWVNNNNEWSIVMPAFDDDTPLYFLVVAHTDGETLRKRLGNLATVRDSNVHIDLGTIDISSITLGGTIDVMVNGEVPDQMLLQIYFDPDRNEHWRGCNTFDGSWSMTVAPFELSTTLYFFVNYYKDGMWDNKERFLGTVNVWDTDMPDINFELFITTITLGGIVDVTVNGDVPDYMYVDIFFDSNFSWDKRLAGTHVSYDNDNDEYYWSIIIDSYDMPTTLYIRFNYDVFDLSGDYLFSGNIHVTVSDITDQNKTDIDIVRQITTAALSGTANVTIDGEVPDVMYIHAYADAELNEYISGSGIWYDEDDGNYYYSIEIDTTYLDKTIYFFIDFYFREAYYYAIAELGSVFVESNNLTHNFNKNISTITLSGSIDLNINLNGESYNGTDVKVYFVTELSNRNYTFAFGLINLSNNTWSMRVPSFASERTLDLFVEVNFGGKWKGVMSDVTVSVGNSSISNIDLGSFTMDFEGILLSGTAEIVVDGKIQHDENYVFAFTDSSSVVGETMINRDGTWSMLIDPFNSATTVNFWVQWFDNDWNWMQDNTGVSRQVHNTNITGITLGRHEFHSGSAVGGLFAPMNAATSSSRFTNETPPRSSPLGFFRKLMQIGNSRL